MNLKFNEEDKILRYHFGENGIWYTVFLNSKTGTKYMIESKKYIQSLYNEEDRCKNV